MHTMTDDELLNLRRKLPSYYYNAYNSYEFLKEKMEEYKKLLYVLSIEDVSESYVNGMKEYKFELCDVIKELKYYKKRR